MPEKLYTILFLPAQVAICCSDQESLFPVDFKHLSEEPSPLKSSVDMPYGCDILISQDC